MTLSPESVLEGYMLGIFPMGDPHTGEVHWYSPDPRGIIPLDAFHTPRRLAQQVRKQEYDICSNRDFEAVITGCADRDRTWITKEIRDAYIQLHEMGFAHSVECWRGNKLAGGIYGVALRGAFFGESMFYRESNASKIALVHLVRQLKAGGFTLFDVQYSTKHLEQFGAKDIPRDAFEDSLADSLQHDATWWPSHE